MRVASCCRSSTEGGIRRDVVRNPPLGAVMYVGLIIPGLSTYYIQRYINNGKNKRVIKTVNDYKALLRENRVCGTGPKVSLTQGFATLKHSKSHLDPFTENTGSHKTWVGVANSTSLPPSHMTPCWPRLPRFYGSWCFL
uniref:Transmembrane protein n=1 Tax=Naja naja TaxID=35670 RepID=A0A8C6XJM0_NAJNA